MLSAAQITNLGVIGGYLLMIIGVGVYFAMKRKSASQFMTADQTMPGWAVGLSMFGSYISSISFLANPAQSFAGNWLWAVFTLTTPIGLLIGSTIFMRFYRHSGTVSAYTHLEARFGTWARSYSVFVFLIIQMARMGTILFLLSQAVLPLLGGDPVRDLWLVRMIIIGVGVLMTLYTLFGGIEAVVWTGVIQSVILVLGPVICLLTLFLKMPGGPTAMLNIDIADHKFGLGPYNWDMINNSFWLVFIFSVVGQISGWGTDQSYVQRYVSAKSDRDAARSIWIAGLLYMPVAMVFWFIGSALYAFYKVQPERLPGGLPADSVFPHFIAHEIMPGLSGLVIAAIFAASMDSNLNSMATLTLMDGYRRFIRPKAGDRESMWVLYGGTIFWGACSIAYGLLMTLKGATTTIEFSAKVGGLLGGGVFGLFLLGLIWHKITSGIAAIATTAGVLLVTWMSLSRWPIWPAQWNAWRSPWNEVIAGAAGTFVILLVGFSLTWLKESFFSLATVVAETPEPEE